MNAVKIGLYAVVAVLVALLAGFLWGRAGKSSLETQLADTQVQLDLAEARGWLVAARVDLFEVNFGRASQHLQAAKPRLQDAAVRLTDAKRSDDATRVKDVAARVNQAQDQAGRLDQSANTTLAAAIAALEPLSKR